MVRMFEFWITLSYYVNKFHGNTIRDRKHLIIFRFENLFKQPVQYNLLYSIPQASFALKHKFVTYMLAGRNLNKSFSCTRITNTKNRNFLRENQTTHSNLLFSIVREINSFDVFFFPRTFFYHRLSYLQHLYSFSHGYSCEYLRKI